MKKEKFMFSTVVCMAIVGGILAFKAHKIGSAKYCFTITNEQPHANLCTLTAVGIVRETSQAGEIVYYTSTDSHKNCGQLDCPYSGIFEIE